MSLDDGLCSRVLDAEDAGLATVPVGYDGDDAARKMISKVIVNSLDSNQPDGLRQRKHNHGKEQQAVLYRIVNPKVLNKSRDP